MQDPLSGVLVQIFLRCLLPTTSPVDGSLALKHGGGLCCCRCWDVKTKNLGWPSLDESLGGDDDIVVSGIVDVIGSRRRHSARTHDAS
jgi:hypothetical protein